MLEFLFTVQILTRSLAFVSVLGNKFVNCLFSILFDLYFVLKFMVVFS